MLPALVTTLNVSSFFLRAERPVGRLRTDRDQGDAAVGELGQQKSLVGVRCEVPVGAPRLAVEHEHHLHGQAGQGKYRSAVASSAANAGSRFHKSSRT